MAPSQMSSAEWEAVIPIRSFNRSYSSTMEAMSDWSIIQATSGYFLGWRFLMYPFGLVQSNRWSCISSSVESVSPANNLAIKSWV